MRAHRGVTSGLVLLVATATVACEGNPPLGPGPGLNVEVTRSSDHVHTLSEVTFTVAVTDQHGDPVTDFEVVQMERQLQGDDAWRAIELAPAGDVYEGAYAFATSGEYYLRVMAQEQGAAEMAMLHEMHDPLHVGRAHADLGDWRAEFESFPGHIHEGEEAALRFWVTEEHADGDSHPVEGMTPEVHVRNEETGDEVTLTAEEHEPGVYEIHHHFDAPGEVHVGLHATTSTGDPGEAAFHFHVAHGH